MPSVAAALECRWYRFDFEYRLPSSLPTSFKQPDGKLIFYASGSLTRDNGTIIETLNSHFHVRGKMDIDHLPPILHESIRRKKVKVFEHCSNCIRYNHGHINMENARAPLRHDEDDTSVDSDSETRQVRAAISLNSQAFTHGQHVIAEVTLDNCTNGHVSYAAKFEQVQCLAHLTHLLKFL